MQIIFSNFIICHHKNVSLWCWTLRLYKTSHCLAEVYWSVTARNGKYRLCLQCFSSGLSRFTLSRSITPSQYTPPPSISTSPVAGKPGLPSLPHPWFLPRNSTELVGNELGGQKSKPGTRQHHSLHGTWKELPRSHWTYAIPRSTDERYRPEHPSKSALESPRDLTVPLLVTASPLYHLYLCFPIYTPRITASLWAFLSHAL